MAGQGKVEGVGRLVAQFKAKSDEAKKGPTVAVGFTAAYAMYVHENLEAHHPVGQAKFLEQPARALRDEFRRIIREALAARKPLAQALTLAGLRLQREAQLLCPVDTGSLRGSAFTRLESQ